LNSQSRLEVLSEIAFRLNQNSSLIFTDKLIGIVLDEESSSAMASSLENYGIITSSKLKNETNKYKFTHQIIQEFLSAYYIWLKGDVKLLPQRPSENVFWFDIPLYLSELDPRNSLNTLQYLNDKGDFFSIARILKSSDIESNSKIDIEYVTHKIVDSLKGFDSYSRAPETIIELGGKAESILINEVKMVNKKLLASEEIWASKNISVEDEIMYDQNWRVVGRSIHLLSLYNSRLLLNVFEQRIDEIMSVHLVYHILEYILRNLSSWKIKDKFRATRLLSRIKVNDPIISYYKFHIKHVAIGLGFGKINKAREEKLWDDVYDFIMSVTYTTNRKFFANFWIRNHGIECLTDFMPKGKSKVFFEGISKIFELENEFHYPTTKPFYVAIFKSSLIGLKKLKAQSINVEVGIEQLVKSPRLFESSWARKYIYDYIDNADQTDFAHLSKMVSLVNDDQVKSRISLKLNQLN